MSFHAVDAWWWPFLFILLAGWLVTDFWRFLGVYFGGRISADSELLVLARAVATALVAAVLGNLVVFPTGILADTPLIVRIGTVALGFAAYLASGRRVIVGIVVCETALIAALLLQE
jgi:hypothetical protein